MVGKVNVLKAGRLKIAVFRALQLGDMLCVIPALRALRNSCPDAEIILVGLPWSSSLIQRFANYFDRFIQFSGWPGLPEQVADPIAIVGFLQSMQQENFDLVLQLQGNGNIVNPMLELWGGRTLAGFTMPQLYSSKKHSIFIDYPLGMHEVERHLILMKYLGADACDTAMEFPILDNDWDDFEQLRLSIPAGEYVCIHPGSRGRWRQWPAAYFAALGDYCAGEGMKVILTGTQDELSLTNEVASIMKYEPIVLAGKTSLGAAAILIKFAFALISNCTGPSHIAAALQTPSVVISMDGEPERWAPINKKLHRTIDWTKTPDYGLVLAELVSIFSMYPK